MSASLNQKQLTMKEYAITIENKGAVIVYAKTKNGALCIFRDKGYDVSLSDIYLY